MLAPDCRVDELLSEYLCRSSFVHLEHETKRNYTSDYRVFFDFLWGRGLVWNGASADNLFDFHDWRVRSPRNPDRVGGSKWNRELAALARLYDWPQRRGHVAMSPVLMRSARGRYGGGGIGSGRAGQERPIQ
nr:site-specific integrase [Streptomyces typhae]